jgi:hypothetical protein
MSPSPRMQAGYREGIEEGKAETLQQGFNLGFQEGARAGFALGRMSACVKTLEIYAGQVSGTSHLQEPVQRLGKRIQDVPPHLAMLAAFKHVMTRVPEVEDLRPHFGAGREGSQATGRPQQSSEEEEEEEEEEEDEEDEEEGGGSMPSVDELAEAVSRMSAANPHEPPAGLQLPDIRALLAEMHQELATLGYDMGTFSMDSASRSPSLIPPPAPAGSAILAPGAASP